MKEADRASIMENANNWCDKPKHLSAANKMLDHLIEQPLYNLQHISYASIKRITNSDLDDYELMSVIMSIAISTGLLCIKYELIYGDEQVDIDEEDLSYAKETGYLVHPVSGNEIHNYKTHVYVYFQYSHKLCQIKESGFDDSDNAETLI